MRTLLLAIVAFVAHINADAHDPNLATYRIYQENGRWLLRIDMAASSLEFLPTTVLREEEHFNASFARYLKEHISLVIDGDQSVVLGTGGIKAGHHSVEAIFFLDAFTADWLTFDAHITCFAENDRQRHLIRVPGANTTSKIFLDGKNKYATHFEQVRIQVE
jgi:hypothetical protein